MIKFKDGQITDLLPPSMAKNVEMQCVSYALQKQVQKIMALADQTRTVAMIDQLPESILDILATELRTPYYQESMGLKTKRNIIKRTLLWHTKAGTPSAVSEDLPIKGNRKKKKKTVRKTQARAAAGDSIEKRPEEIDTREEFGHWEMDTVIGKKGESKHSLLVLTERKTREELMFLLMEHTTEQVVSCINRLEEQWGEKFSRIFKTITVDNGTEFSDCDGLQKSILQDGENRTKIYYCHPYSSYERGSNENQNKLVRRKVPKGTNFDDRTEDDIKEVENWINNYPRLLFGWETAQMQFDKELALIA